MNADPSPIFGLFCLFVFNFLPHCEACGISVPPPGIEPVPPGTEAWSPNRWTTREFPITYFWFRPSDEFQMSWGSVTCRGTGFHFGEGLTHVIPVGITEPKNPARAKEHRRQAAGSSNQTRSSPDMSSTTTVLRDHTQYADIFGHLVFFPQLPPF